MATNVQGLRVMINDCIMTDIWKLVQSLDDANDEDDWVGS